jgi:ubiquitin-conjugating enzyme E2 variant
MRAQDRPGYSPTYRALEVGAILAFWVITAALVVKLEGVWAQAHWLILAGIAAGFVFSDFISGFVHWAADTWGSTDMPVLGKAVIGPFREHHVDPEAMTRHDYVETNGANCMIAVPVALLTLAVPMDVEGLEAPGVFATAFGGSVIFWAMMTNQIHKWAHLPPGQTPGWLRAAQDLHLVLPPKHHQVHHTPPFETYYCITTGWLNPLLHRLRFFRHLERLVTSLTGLRPRRLDLGASAGAPVPTGRTV